MKFKVYRIEQKEICVPSEDYYAPRNDFQTDTLNVLKFVEELDKKYKKIPVGFVLSGDIG